MNEFPELCKELTTQMATQSVPPELLSLNVGAADLTELRARFETNCFVFKVTFENGSSRVVPEVDQIAVRMLYQLQRELKVLYRLHFLLFTI